MKGGIGDRLRRGGVILAWVPIAAAAAAVVSERPASSATADASVEIVGDTLVIAGTPEDDRILIKATRDPDVVRVIFNGARLGRFGPVAGVEVDAGEGDDTVLVSGALELPVRLYGGDGDDRLRGGGPDLVFGEHGDDVLTASRGRDALDGGPGGNRLRLKGSMGEVRIGATAAGDALRILAQAYDLPPLDPSATAPGPIVVGPAELLDDEVVEQLRTSYQAGHAIALTGAERSTRRRCASCSARRAAPAGAPTSRGPTSSRSAGRSGRTAGPTTARPSCSPAWRWTCRPPRPGEAAARPTCSPSRR